MEGAAEASRWMLCKGAQHLRDFSLQTSAVPGRAPEGWAGGSPRPCLVCPAYWDLSVLWRLISLVTLAVPQYPDLLKCQSRCFCEGIFR